MSQILSAIFYCHRIQIMHRDIQPKNIIITKNLNAIFIDFGLSKETKETIHANSKAGILFYGSRNDTR